MPTASAPHATPFFSVITVNYNGGAHLLTTLGNVKAQDFTDYEHIVVDGASTDGSKDVLAAYDNPRMTFVSEPDSGLYHAMNKALARAKGEYVIFLNAGDKFHSANTLRTIADAAAASGNPGILYGQTDIVNAEGRKLADRHLHAPAELNVASFSEGMVVCHQAFIVRRTLAPRFDAQYRYSADYDWCIRCLQESEKNVYIDDTLIDYLAEGLTTNNRFSSLAERFNIMATYYGFFPTLFRHVRFLPRYLRRRRVEKQVFGA